MIRINRIMFLENVLAALDVAIELGPYDPFGLISV
jgi:hypothetical protein